MVAFPKSHVSRLGLSVPVDSPRVPLVRGCSGQFRRIGVTVAGCSAGYIGSVCNSADSPGDRPDSSPGR